mgnify:CR=1 FL=1
MSGVVSATPLADQMRKLAVTHPRRDELEAAADNLDAAASASDTPIPKLLGAWAKARRLWCEISGEPLV